MLIVALCGLIAWRGEVATRSLREALQTRIRRAVAGPPVPSSSSPRKLIGPLVRRALLREGGLGATDRPGGRVVETIRLRQFVDVYDEWPTLGRSTHLRVGNRKPIGWILSDQVLDWRTRLVFLPDLKGSNRSPCLPVLEWNAEGAIRIAIWEDASPWIELKETRWLTPGQVEDGSWGVWLSREELLASMGRVSRSTTAERLFEERLRMITGQFGRGPGWSQSEIQEVRSWLPRQVALATEGETTTKLQKLARVNEEWSDEAVWSGVGFRFLRLSDLQ